jgi:hypothetical protein
MEVTGHFRGASLATAAEDYIDWAVLAVMYTWPEANLPFHSFIREY